MAWNKNTDISMEIEKEFDFIIEEGQNTSINLRRISWNGRPSKIDIRKWVYQDGNERAMKGVSLSDEGADELANVLVEQGYGNTSRLIKTIKQREDYNNLNGDKFDVKIDDDGSEEYYDPSELLEGYIDAR